MLQAQKKLEKHREQPEEKIINRNNFRNDRMMELAEQDIKIAAINTLKNAKE